MLDRLWDFLTGWWYRESRRGYHPMQGTRCAIVSFVLGEKMTGGSFPTEVGTDYWWRCERCGEGDSAL